MTRGQALVALALALALAGPPALAAYGTGRGDAPVAWVVAAPWADPEAVVAAAGARLAGPRQPRLGRIVAADGDDLARRLRAAGAWAVLGDPRLLDLCGVTR